MGIQERDHYRSRCRGGGNIKINLKEIGWEGMGWIDLAQEGAVGRLLWAQYVIAGYINCREFLDYLKSCYLVSNNSVVIVFPYVVWLLSPKAKMLSSFPCGDTYREDSVIAMDGISVQMVTVHSSRSKNSTIVYLLICTFCCPEGTD